MSDATPTPTIADLFPEDSKLLLTGGGKEFIERIGVDAARRVVLSVMMGENVRTQTEPLTRRRIAQVTGAMVALFAQGGLQVEDFSEHLSEMAVRQLAASPRNKIAAVWPAQWLLGLTGKSVQNVLRNSSQFDAYIADFEAAVDEASAVLQAEAGDLRMSLGFVEADGRAVELDWRDITRLTTAIGSATLTLRGSDKSIYGKLFEKLVLGSTLAVLGFERVDLRTNTKTSNVFWLSDSSDDRESDATLLLRPGKVARFDIGFIGPGNSEVSKDKLSRYARALEHAGAAHEATTFIVVDRLPQTGKTKKAAQSIDAEILQMSMNIVPRDLARRLETRFGFKHELQTMPEEQIRGYLAAKLAAVPITDFLTGVRAEDLAADTELTEAQDEVEAE